MKIFRLNNLGILVYLIINTTLLGFLFVPVLRSLGYMMPHLLVVLGYAALVAIAVSPVGELILRQYCGARSIRRTDWRTCITPMFQRLVNEARAADLTIPRNIYLFYVNDPMPNAFAIGRRSVCMTTGLMAFPVEEITAMLAHEIGHIRNRDSQILLLVTVGNLLVGLIMLAIQIIRIVITAVCLIFLFSAAGRAALIITQVITWFPIMVLRGIVSLSLLFANMSRRFTEYDADAFAASLGYQNALISALAETDHHSQIVGTRLWHLLNSSHPDSNQRIARLQRYSGHTFLGRSVDSALGRVMCGNSNRQEPANGGYTQTIALQKPKPRIIIRP